MVGDPGSEMIMPVSESIVLRPDASPFRGIRVNAPEIFAREDFMEWLRFEGSAFTWHKPEDETAHEYSDTIVLVDRYYEGSASDMPEDIWIAICDVVYRDFGGKELASSPNSHVYVHLTNFEVD